MRLSETCRKVLCQKFRVEFYRQTRIREAHAILGIFAKKNAARVVCRTINI